MILALELRYAAISAARTTPAPPGSACAALGLLTCNPVFVIGFVAHLICHYGQANGAIFMKVYTTRRDTL